MQQILSYDSNSINLVFLIRQIFLKLFIANKPKDNQQSIKLILIKHPFGNLIFGFFRVPNERRFR